MAGFWYFCTPEEWWELLDNVLEYQALKFVIDKPYSDANVSHYGRITDELRVSLPPRPRVYLLGDAFSDKPPFLRKQESGVMAGKFFVDISRGGPMLDFIMPAQFEERGLFWFGEGTLTFQKLYWNDSLTQATPASKALKDAFGLIKRTLQRRLLERKIGGQETWISPKAWELFEAAKAAFPVAGKCYTKNGEVPPPTPWKRTPIVRAKPESRS